MWRRDLFVVVSTCAICFMSGCAVSPDEDGSEVGDLPGPSLSAQALNANALNANALNANALYPGALTPGMLSVSALAPSTLGASAWTYLLDPSGDGTLARQLLEYTVSCAFDTTQSFSFTWTDASGVDHAETYPGLLGLATTWASQTLDPAGQGWVSACLVSRVNWYGVHVQLSSRGAHPALATSGGELATYTMQEGAFWGNVFASPPTAYACDDTPDDSHSRSVYRDCAAGHLDASGNLVSCGIVQRLGSCDTYCAPLGDGQYHPSCAATGGHTGTSPVITVFLQ